MSADQYADLHLLISKADANLQRWRCPIRKGFGGPSIYRNRVGRRNGLYHGASMEGTEIQKVTNVA